MSSFFVYTRIPDEQIRAELEPTVKAIEDWFAQNPRRRVCNGQFWYGRMAKIKRKTVREQVTAIVEEACANETEES